MKSIMALLSLLLTFSLAFGQDAEAREILRRAMEADRTQSFEGVRSTEVGMGDRRMRTEERIWRAGARATRIEIMAPPPRRGEVMLYANGRFQHYFPAQRRVEERPAPPEIIGRLQNIVGQVRQHGFRLAIVGEETIAGRRCVVVALNPPPRRPNPPGRPAPMAMVAQKLWIDKETGLMLKHEAANDGMGRRFAMEFSRVNLKPNFSRDIFELDVPPGTERVKSGPGRFDSIEEAQSAVRFRIKRLRMIRSEQIDGVFIMPAPEGPIVATRFKIEGKPITFFQTLRGDRMPPPQLPPHEREGKNAHFWERDGYWFGLVADRSVPQQRLVRMAEQVD